MTIHPRHVGRSLDLSLLIEDASENLIMGVPTILHDLRILNSPF